jgi:hypothetical protein
VNTIPTGPTTTPPVASPRPARRADISGDDDADGWFDDPARFLDHRRELIALRASEAGASTVRYL